MDLNLSTNPADSFKLFQGKVVEEYDKIAEEFNLTVIDGGQPIHKQQEIVRDLVKNALKKYHPTPFQQKKENVYVR